MGFGFLLGAVSFVFLAISVNVLAATLALAAIAFYVFVYTLWLKRSTTQNIVIGGAAGAAPALVGWAAVTGTLAAPAWLLFAIVFVWTPPHFWALALRYRGDYAAAGVPMLPVVKGEAETRRQILLYSLAMFAMTLLLCPFGGHGPGLPGYGPAAGRWVRVPGSAPLALGPHPSGPGASSGSRSCTWPPCSAPWPWTPLPLPLIAVTTRAARARHPASPSAAPRPSGRDRRSGSCPSASTTKCRGKPGERESSAHAPGSSTMLG